jgi:hypothetical protein
VVFRISAHKPRAHLATLFDSFHHCFFVVLSIRKIETQIWNKLDSAFLKCLRFYSHCHLNIRNFIHGSYGPDTAKDEMALCFTPKELVSYTSNQEKWVYGVN